MSASAVAEHSLQLGATPEPSQLGATPEPSRLGATPEASQLGATPEASVMRNEDQVEAGASTSVNSKVSPRWIALSVVAVVVVVAVVLLVVFLSPISPNGNGGVGSAESDNQAGGAETGALDNLPVVNLTQVDFEPGTYRIRESARYVLQEDIVFNPNPPTDTQDAYDSFFPTAEQLGDPDQYPAPLYTLGWFAGITVEVDNVIIDLNGFTFDEGIGHALMQRFYTHISLANSVFVTGQGPHSFTHEGQFISARNVIIRNGTLGRSSHHGVHGNLNENVLIEDINFVDFEVAAVQLNGVEGFTMQRCSLENRKDVPVLGTFSSARFLQRYVDDLVNTGSNTTITIQGQELSARDIRENLRTSIDNVYTDVVELGLGEIDASSHPVERAIYANEGQLVNGNSYGVVLNHVGVAVNGFPTIPTDPKKRASKNVVLQDINIEDQRANIVEVVSLRIDDKPLTDPVGSVMQILKTDASGEYVTINATTVTGDVNISQASYIGNPIVDAQMFVGKAILNGDFDNSPHSVKGSRVTREVIDWIEAGEAGRLGDLAPVESGFLCNGDDMSHVQKGMIGFKIDASENVTMEECHVRGVTSSSLDGSPLCGNYSRSHLGATLPGYNGAHVRAFSFAGTNGSEVRRCSASEVHSEEGNAYGFSIITDSRRIVLKNVEARHISSSSANATGIFANNGTWRIEAQDYYVEDVTAAKGLAQDIDNIYTKFTQRINLP